MFKREIERGRSIDVDVVHKLSTGMPPKTAQKRAREPSAGANPPNVAVASAPLSLRRTRSNSNASNTSDTRDNDEDGAPRSKRSRVDKNAGRLSETSDASMGEEEDDIGGKGVNGSRRMPSAKRATGRRKSTAVTVGGGIAQVRACMMADPLCVRGNGCVVCD